MRNEPKIIAGMNAVEEAKQWFSIDDRVMGGRSQSQIIATADNTTIFTGHVSLANHGGFASVRARIRAGTLQGYQGLALRLRGDGRRYRLRLRTNDQLDGPAYEVSFRTRRGAWIEVRAPFEAFDATFRGHRLKHATPLDAEFIEQIGLMIADRQAGTFKLEIDWITAYDDSMDATSTLLQTTETVQAA